jgi:hypothetical protein
MWSGGVINSKHSEYFRWCCVSCVTLFCGRGLLGRLKIAPFVICQLEQQISLRNQLHDTEDFRSTFRSISHCSCHYKDEKRRGRDIKSEMQSFYLVIYHEPVPSGVKSADFRGWGRVAVFHPPPYPCSNYICIYVEKTHNSTPPNNHFFLDFKH